MLALQGHGLDVAIGLAAMLVVFRHAILRAVLGVFVAVTLAALAAGAIVLVQALHP